MLLSAEREMKRNFEEKRWDVNKTRPSQIRAKLSKDDLFASRYVDKSKWYEHWRVENLYYYKNVLEKVSLPLNRDDRTVADWCEPWIDISAFLSDEQGLCRFWLEEVEIRFMQRNWLRWAVRILQPFRKISGGNPYDEQDAAYLVDAERFYTSDRRYYECLKVIYDDRVVDMAEPVLIDADIKTAFEQLRQSCR